MDFINEDETGLFRLPGLSSVFISFHFLIEDEARALRLPVTAKYKRFYLSFPILPFRCKNVKYPRIYVVRRNLLINFR